jgi:hypothetical protein
MVRSDCYVESATVLLRGVFMAAVFSFVASLIFGQRISTYLSI